MLNYHENIITKQHYKMYKAGKNWLFAAITAFTLGAGAFAAAPILNVNTARVEADLQSYPEPGWKENADSRNKGYVYYQIPFDSSYVSPTQSQVEHFDSDLDGTIGKWTDLPWVSRAAAAARVNESVDVQLRNVYVRRINGQITYTIVPNVTLLYVRPLAPSSGRNNSIQPLFNGVNPINVKYTPDAGVYGQVIVLPVPSNTQDMGSKNSLSVAFEPSAGSDFPKYTFNNFFVLRTLQQVNDQRTADIKNAITSLGGFGPITAEQKRVNALIDQDPTLTISEKALQQARITSAVSNAEQNISTAQSTADYNKAKDAGIKAINAFYQPGVSLPDQRQAVKGAIQAKASLTINQIGTDPTLLQSEKYQETSAVSAAVNALFAKIDAASDADGINKLAVDSSIESQIVKGWTPGDPIPQQQTAAVSQINTNAQTAINQINQDPTLDSGQKQTQITQVNTAKQAALDAVTAAVTGNTFQTADLIAAQVKVSTGWNSLHTVGQSIADRQSDAKAEINGLVSDVKQKIDQDTSLNNTEKAQEKKNVDVAAGIILGNITKAQTADAIILAKNDETNRAAIANAYQPAKITLPDQKNNAKKQISQWVAQVTSAINADPTLVQDDQDRQISSLNTLAQQMNQDIDNQVDAQHLLDLMATEQAKLQAVHVSGTVLSDRITSAQEQIKSEGQKISGQIQNDVTILEASRTQQLKNVAQYVANVITSISQQPNAEGVKQAVAQAIRNIDLVYTPGLSLPTQQRNAFNQLTQKAESIKTTIATDVALTQAQQAYQKGLIDQIVTAAQAKIAQQQTAQTIWDAEAQAEQNVVAQYEPSANIQAAQQSALSALDQANQQTTSKIQTEPTLSQAEKDQELGDLATAYSSAQKSIQGSLTAASATAAGQTGSSNLQAVFHTGMVVSDRQNVAKADLNQNLSDTNTAISQDVTLTNAAKQQQQKAAKDAYNQALIALTAAKAAQDILDQTATGDSNIAGTHVSGPSLTNQRQVVQSLLDGENNQVAGAISADVTLTAADKSAQANNLATAYQQASQALSAAQDAQAILDAKTTGLANIDRTHIAGTGVDQQRKAAQAALDSENTRVQGLINNDKTLLNSKKQAELAQLQAAYLQAQANLNQAQDAQGILDAKTTGINSLAPNYTAGQPLADQQQVATDALIAAKNTVANAISDDGTLLNTQKSAQQQDALKAQENGQTAISQATDAQGIADAKANALTQINNAHQPQTDIASQRQSALDALQAENSQIQSAIQGDVTLLDSEKTAQEEKLAQAYQAGQTALAADQAPDAQSILDAKNAALTQIDGSHVPGTDFSSQLQAAIKSLQYKHTYTIQAIRADKTLTTADQVLQVGNADTAFQTAQSAVNADADAQTLADDLATGLTNIAATHQVGTAVADQQQAAISVLQGLVKQAVTAINTDSTLLTSQQQSQVSQVNQALATAEAKIQADDNAQAIQNDQATATSQINAIHTPGQALDKQQANALSQLQATNDQVLAAITEDATLTDAVSTQQKSALATAYASAQDQISQATNAQAVADQLTQQTNNLQASHQAGDTIANQITAAQSNLKTVQDGLQNDIQADATLLDVEKASQWAQVQSDNKKAQASLAKLTTAQAILDQFNKAKNQLNADHVSGVALDQQQSNAVVALTSQAKQTKSDIVADPTLTTATQIAQGQAVNQSNDTYATLIGQATTAQDVANQKATGLAAIKADHQVGEAVSTQAQAAIVALTKLASQIANAISLDATLTDSQEASQRAQVQADLQEAQGKLQSAQTAQAVADLQNQYQEKLSADHQSASSLSDQLLQAQTTLSDYASGLQGKISSDPTLLVSEQTTQVGAVTTALAQKKTDLANAATSAQALQDALTQAEKNLDRLHQPGLDLPTQIANASQTLTRVAKSTNQAITNDVTLTESARQAQRDAVTQLVAQAQADFNNETTAQQLADRLAQANNDVANAHQAAQPLSDQKKTALGQLQATYQATQKIINSDVTLTNAVKTSQLTTLDSNYSLGQTAINNATSAQLVSDTQFSWSQKLNNSHVVGKDLDSQRVDAKTAIKTQYTTTLTALSTDKTLLTADNQTQTTNVNNAYAQAVASLAVNQTADAQSIQDAVAAGKAAIQAAYMPGTPLADQQKAATDVVDRAAETVISEISNDETLTVSAVGTQSQAVTDAANVLLKKITTATDAQTIANTITNVQSVLSALHTAGQPVNSQQKAANTAVTGAGDSTSQAINGDATLNKTEKAAQKAAVAQIVQAAITKISADTKAAQIEADKNQAIQNINAAYQRGQAISSQQAAAIAVLQAEVTKVKGQIENDGTLPEAERATQTAAVDDDYKLAAAAVNKASTADDINTAQVNGINSIDGDYRTGDSIALQKQTAVESLRDEFQKVQVAIQDDPTLDTATIINQLAALQMAQDTAIAKVNASDTQTADQIESAKNDGVTAIDNSHVVGTDLKTQVQDALNQLEALNTAVTSSINTDNTLTNATKQKQNQNLAAAYQDGQTNVKKAVNAQQIEDAVTNGLSAMDQTYVEGTSVDNQRANALNQLQNLAQGFKALINIDPTLTNADKQSQAQALAQAVTVAQTALSAQNTPDAESIAQALSQANQNLAMTHVSLTAVADRVTAAKAQLDQELQTIDGAIDGDVTLLSTQKATQKSAAQDAHDRAVASFVSSFLLDAQTVQDRLNVGLKAVDASHTSGTDLTTQQNRAIDELTQTAKNTKQDITNDNTLLEAERTRQRGLIDQSLADATKALQAAKDADSVQSLQAQYDPQIAADHQVGTPLADQQASAKADLNQYAGSDSNQTGVWLAIERDQALTNAQKADQKADLATTLASYQDKVIVTPDAQSLADLVAKAHNALDATHVLMSSLADQRVAANKQLSVQLAQTKGQIAAETTLTTAEITAQSKAADSALADAQAKLAKAADAQAILDATTAGLQNISQQFQPGQAISGQINDAKEAIQNAVDAAKTAISTDNTLNTADKASQDQAVDATLTGVDDDFSKTSNAQAILDLKNKTIAAIDGVHQAGATISTQQQKANNNLAITANQVQQAISNDPNLTNAQRVSQQQAVTTALASAQSTINALSDAQSILDAQAQQTVVIQDQHVLQPSVQAQQTTARQKFQDEHNQIRQAIIEDQTLTTADRNSQLAAIDQALTTANNLLTNTVDAQDVLDAQTQGIKGIDASHVPGFSLDAQVQNAEKTLADLQDSLTAAVMNDPNLLDSSKSARKLLLSASLSKYTDKLNDALADSTTTGQTILDLLTAGQQELQKDRQSDDGQGASVDQPLATQITAALQQVNQKSQNVQNNINQDDSLSQAQIDQQTADNQQVLQQAQTDLNGKTNAQALADRLQTALSDLNQIHVPNVISLADQKSAAVANLDKLYGQIKDAITADNTLTSSQKDQQIADLDHAKAQGDDKLKQSTRATELNQQIEPINQALSATHVVGTAVDSQRQSQETWLANQIQALTDRLAAQAVSSADETTLQETIRQTKASLQGQIEQAANADDLQSVQTNGLSTLSGVALHIQQAQARFAINQTADQQVVAINQDASLTKAGQGGQDDQVQQVNDARASILAQIDAATAADQLTALQNTGLTTLTQIHQPAAKSVDQQRQGANDQTTAAVQTVTNVIATAKDKGQLTADQASALTAALNQAQEKASQALTNATTADQINAVIDQLSQDLAGVQLRLQQDVSTNAVNQSAQQVVAAISQDATLDDNEKQVQQANVSAQQQATLQQIASATTVADAQSVETTFDQTVTANHLPGQSIDDRRSQLIEAITTAANQATATINGDVSLTTAAKADQLAQLAQAKDAALAQLAKATTAADGVNFVNQSVTTIAAIHQPAEKTLSQQRQDFLDLITQLANQAAANIDQEKSLTDSETASLKGQVTALQNAAVQSANESLNADDLQAGQQALQDGLDQVKFMTQQDVDLHALNLAQLDANQVIANNQTLSDVEKASQNIQVMLLFNQYQQALLAAQNLASLASAVNNGVKAVAGVPQDGATVQQRTASYIDRLTVEKKRVQSRIDADNTLTTADKNQQKAQVDQVLADETVVIQGAVSVQDGVDKTSQALQKIDAVYQTGPSLLTQQVAVRNTAANDLNTVNSAISGDNTLSTDEISNLDGLIDQYKANFVTAVQAAQSADEMNQALADFHTNLTKISNQHLKYNLVHQLQQSAMDTTAAIDNDPTLSASAEQEQLAAVQTNLNQATAAISAVEIDDDQAQTKLASALSTGTQQIDASHQPGPAVSSHADDWQKAVTTTTNQVKDVINADPTLTSADRSRQVASVQQTLANTLAALEDVATVQAGDTIVTSSQKVLSAIHVAGLAVADRQNTANTTIQDTTNAEQQKINQNASQLQPSDQSALTDQVTAAKNAATAAINSAQSADEINQAVADLNQKLAGIDLDLAHRVGQFQLAEANELIQAAIDGDVTLLPDVKASQQANRLAALRKTTADLAATTTIASVQQSASDGVAVIQAAHQVGQSLADQKQALITNLQKADQAVKSQIDADPTLPQTEKDRQKAAIDRGEAQTMDQISVAADATAAKQVADTGTTTNQKIYVPGQTITGDSGQAAQFKKQVTDRSAVVQQAINTAATKGQITADQQTSLTQQLQRVVSAAEAAGTAATTADQILTANQKLATDLIGVQYNLAINIANYQLLVAYNGADQAINDDPTLSNQEKAEQAEIVNVRWNTGQQSLAAAKTVDEVAQFTSDTVAAINQVHHGGQPVEERMQSYTAKIQASAAQAVAQINQDKSLSPTGQAVIVEAVQNNRDWYLHELQGAKSVVEAETMVQDDLNAMAFGQNATSPLGQGKAEWFARIYNELKATDQSINGYLALSADEKSALLQTMQSLVTTTNSQISQGQTLDQTVQSLQDLILDLTKLNLQASKTDAANRLQSVFETTKADITADRSLSHQEVQDQIRTAQAAYDQASAQVQQAGDLQAVASALTAGQEAVEASHQEQAALIEQLPKLNQQVDDTVKTATTTINQDQTLTATEKQQQIETLNQKASGLKKTMTNAADLREADEDLQQGLVSLNGVHQPGLVISGATGQAAQLKNQVSTASQQEQDQIDQAATNGFITTEQRDVLTAALQAATTQAQAAANQAENADQIQTASAAWQAALAQSQTALAKDIAFHQLGVAQSQANAAIVADDTLSQQEKGAQQTSLQEVVDTWTKSINDSQNAAQVTGTSETAMQIINGVHHGGQSVADRLSDFNQQIVAAATALAAKTKQQPNLSVAGQQIIVRAITGMQDWFVNELKSAQTVVAAETMVQDDVTALTLGQPAQTPVAEAKADWVSRLYQGLQATDQTIHGYENLTDDDVADLMNRLGELTDETNNQVQEGASATVVTAALQKFLDALPTLTFEASQQDAVRQLEQTETATQQAISADRTLSDQQVQNQQQAVKTALDQAIQAVKATQDSAAMAQALADGRAAVENAHQEQGDLAQQLPKLNQQVDEVAQQVVSAINQDPTLSVDEKQQQIKAVQQQAKDLKNELENAVDPRTAYQDLDRGLKQLPTIHRAGQAIVGPDGQVAQFEKQIQAASQQMQEQIYQALQSGLITQNQHQVLTTAVQQAVAKANDTASQATSADEVNAGSATLATDLATVQSNLAKDSQTTKLFAAQEAANQAIDRDASLSGQEKAQQKAAVQIAVTAGLQAIQDQQDSTQVVAAGDQAITSVQNVHQSGRAVANRLADFDQQVMVAATTLVDSIQQEKQMSVAGQQVLIAAVNDMRDWFLSELTTAKDVVSAETMVEDDVTALTFGPAKQTSIAQMKADWVKKLYQALQSTVQTVDGYQHLTDDEKAGLMVQLTQLTQQTNADVASAADGNQVVTSLQQFVASLPTIVLQASQADARQQLQQFLNATLASIQSDRTLSDSDVQNQVAAAQAAHDQALATIAAAQTEAVVADALATGQANIQAAHQAKSDLNGQLPALNQRIDTATKQVVEAINQDPTLSSQDKHQQIATANQKADALKAIVEKAADPRAADQALQNGLQDIDQVHQPGQSLEEQTRLTLQTVDDDATTAKQKLPEGQQAAFDSAINAAQQTAEKDLAQAQNADDIQQALAKFKQTVASLQEQAGAKAQAETELAAAKDQAVKQVEHDADSAKQALPTGQVSQFAKDIDEARQVTEKSLAQAQNADDIQRVLAKFRQTVDDLQKQAVAKNKAEAEQTAAKAKVEQAAAKNQAVTQIEQAADSAKQALPAGQGSQFEPTIDQAKQKAMDEVEQANDQKAVDVAVTDFNKELTNVQQQAKAQDQVEQQAKKEADQAINNAKKQLPADEQPQLIDKIQPAERQLMTVLQQARTVGDVQTAYQQFLNSLEQISQQIQQESAQPRETQSNPVENSANPATLMDNLFPAKIALPDTWEVEHIDQPLTFLAVTMASLSIGLTGVGLKLGQLKVSGGKNKTDNH